MSAFTRRTLGKTELQVSPLGIGGGNGIQSEDLLYAFDKGINYFFFSSDLHHWMYRHSVEALRTLCKSGSAVREQTILATVSYVNDPGKIVAVLSDVFFELGIDYIDVFHWGWITDNTQYEPLLRTAQNLKSGGKYSQRLQAMFQETKEVNAELVKRGLVRFAGSSFHSRSMARTYMHHLDVVMLRYNLAHLGAEEEVVPSLLAEKQQNPGMVVFNVAYSLPGEAQPGLTVPTVPECYRFALSQPWVDLVLTGVTTRYEIDQALSMLEKGPLNSDEETFMRGLLQKEKPSLPGEKDAILA